MVRGSITSTEMPGGFQFAGRAQGHPHHSAHGHHGQTGSLPANARLAEGRQESALRYRPLLLYSALCSANTTEQSSRKALFINPFTS